MYVCFSYFSFEVLVNEWPPNGKIAAHSAYDTFSLIVNLVFPTPRVFGVGISDFPFPDHCLILFFKKMKISDE